MNKNLNVASVVCGDTREFLLNFFDWDIYKILLEEFSQLVFNQQNWLKIKNKDLFYSHRIKAIIPDLSVYVPKSSKTLFPCPRKLHCHFSGYKGELMSRDDFLFAFGMDGYDYLVDQYQFKKYPCFTITEDFFVDKRCTYINDWGTFPVHTSYHIPVHKLHHQKNYYDDGIYWTSTQIDFMLLLEEALIPEGFSPESQLTYEFLLKLYQKNPNFIGFDELDILQLFNEQITTEFLTEIEPLVEEYLLKKAQFADYKEHPQGRLLENPKDILGLRQHTTTTSQTSIVIPT